MDPDATLAAVEQVDCTWAKRGKQWKATVMELEVHVKLSMQVQDGTIMYTVVKEAGPGKGGGGGTETNADNLAATDYARP